MARFEEDDLPFGTIRFGGVLRKVCLVCVPEVATGDFVLVHVGMAIARIDREEAEQAFATLAALGQLDEVLDEEHGDERDDGERGRGADARSATQGGSA